MNALLPNTYLDTYSAQVNDILLASLANFDFEIPTDNFEHQFTISAVYSSNIEGNSINLNSFLNWKHIQQNKPTKELKEISDLIAAYDFAKSAALTEKNFLKAHKILSKTFVTAYKRGKYRNDKVGVFDTEGLVYLAIEPELVVETMQQFFAEIQALLIQEIPVTAVFYYASLIHLRFVHIHPFADGNGRAARLLEKWFLAQKLGIQYWKIQSEKYYKENLSNYYKYLNLGANYYVLKYEKSLPFLSMLSNSLK